MQSLCIFPRFKLTPLLAKNYKDRSVLRSRRDHRREAIACLDYIRTTNTTPALEAASGSHEPSPLPSEAHTSSEAKRRSATTPNKLTPGKIPKHDFVPALNIYRSDRANISKMDRATIAEAITITLKLLAPLFQPVSTTSTITKDKFFPVSILSPVSSFPRAVFSLIYPLFGPRVRARVWHLFP